MWDLQKAIFNTSNHEDIVNIMTPELPNLLNNLSEAGSNFDKDYGRQIRSFTIEWNTP